MYLRKSSEAEDRQVQSIDAQKRELGELAKEHGLEIVDVFEESQSAKAPGRPIFTKMIERITRGEAEGLLVWKLNRLARNPIDGGTISWMLQQRVIKQIQTFGRGYYPEDNVIVMAVELGMANQYIRDLSTDTKRGLRERVDKGYPNGVAPIGYLNDLSAEPGNRGWKIDSDRFSCVRQMLETFLTGRYSIRKLMNFANDELGLRTTPRKKLGGKRLGISYVSDTILKNPVYAGFFITGDGARHELHSDVPRMINEDQYWEIQNILGSRGRSRPSSNVHTFAYVGPTVCGHCGSGVTAEHKYQLMCSECGIKFSYRNKDRCPTCQTKIDDMKDPLYLHYIYYHCTRSKDIKCPAGSMSEVNIDGYLSTYYTENLQISESLSKWCIDNLDQLGMSDHKTDLDKNISLEKTIAQKQKELKELAMMKARGLFDDSEFLGLKETTTSEIKALQVQLGKLNQGNPEGLQKAKSAFSLAVGVGEIFKNGTVKEKKETLAELASNLTLKDKKLNVTNAKIYEVIIKCLTQVKAENPSFEPKFCQATQGQNGDFETLCPALLPRQDSNLRPIA